MLEFLQMVGSLNITRTVYPALVSAEASTGAVHQCGWQYTGGLCPACSACLFMSSLVFRQLDLYWFTFSTPVSSPTFCFPLRYEDEELQYLCFHSMCKVSLHCQENRWFIYSWVWGSTEIHTFLCWNFWAFHHKADLVQLLNKPKPTMAEAFRSFPLMKAVITLRMTNVCIQNKWTNWTWSVKGKSSNYVGWFILKQQTLGVFPYYCLHETMILITF